MTVKQATLICFRRLKMFHPSKEAFLLIDKAITNIDTLPIDKLSRWLGYCQCMAIMEGKTTVQDERDFSRPLFHAAYEEMGIEIPPSF